jgi:hypothetical protein
MYLLLILAAPIHAAPDYSTLSQELTELRREVEREESELAGLRGRQESEIRSLAEQKAELEILRLRERLRLEAAQERIRLFATEQGELEERVAALAPVLEESLTNLEQWTMQGLPYRVEERAETLSRMRRDLTLGNLDPRTATAQFWQHIEDELHLTEQVGVSRNVVSLPDERVLARVAHLGLAAAFFELEGERYGQAVSRAEGWYWRELEGGEQRAVADLFSALSRSIRAGAFQLPLAPPEEGA